MSSPLSALFRPGLSLLALLSLCACTAGTSAISESLRLLVPRDAEADRAVLRPGWRYLRVGIDGRVALLVLGYTEPHAGGETEVWYSAKGEVLKTRRGRIVATAGLTTDWREVRLPALPRWSAVGATPIRYQRERDEMPGYRAGIRETLALRAIAAPGRGAPRQIDAARLRWYEERDDNDGAAQRSLYAVHIAGDAETVLYSEQCLTRNLCLTLQWLPVPEDVRG